MDGEKPNGWGLVLTPFSLFYFFFLFFSLILLSFLIKLDVSYVYINAQFHDGNNFFGPYIHIHRETGTVFSQAFCQISLYLSSGRCWLIVCCFLGWNFTLFGWLCLQRPLGSWGSLSLLNRVRRKRPILLPRLLKTKARACLSGTFFGDFFELYISLFANCCQT